MADLSAIFKALGTASSSGKHADDTLVMVGLMAHVTVSPDGEAVVVGNVKTFYMGDDAKTLPGGTLTPDGKAVSIPASEGGEIRTLLCGFGALRAEKRKPIVPTSAARGVRA